MGTRHLTCVVLNNEYKVAQYGQWDGYPSGQGLDILNFLTKEFNREKFVKNLNENVHYVNNEYVNKTYEECEAEKDTQFINMTILDKQKTLYPELSTSLSSKVLNQFINVIISDRHKLLYPELSRDTGSKILKMIQETEKMLGLVDSLSFAKDSLFCEYVYVLDLDKNSLDVYNGFNKEPLKETERFFEMYKDVEPIKKYFPVKLLCRFDLLALPTKEEFLKTCKDAELDEDEETEVL